MPACHLYRKKPVVIEAHQWHRNGDHPDDNVWRPFDDTGKKPLEPREGAVVRRYRTPAMDGPHSCQHCGVRMHDHGWIDTLEGGHVVCPGDWIITGVKGERYPCKPDIFAATYAPVGAEAVVTLSATDVLAERQRQQSVEGWSPQHDDEHEDGEMADAAAAYASASARGGEDREDALADPPCDWPWADAWWKPTTPRRDLVKAGALILAEIERLDRKAAKK